MAGDGAMKLTAEGDRLVKNWQNFLQRLERARAEVRAAETALANSANDLGKWLLPPKPEPGEKIAVWYHDSLIQVENTKGDSGHDYQLTLRYRGRNWGQP